ncbi:hypothetical protein DSO57_1015976 [Entomophthora muscae]|uniref:Uncharacterized protein n=1 Tax=Entomophthora muscae TaxID=34485 RepID=A0ACC2U3F8_9FUNG|nr:hypothetical protein DSO57_1015976 [Entomophthora muscae]
MKAPLTPKPNCLPPSPDPSPPTASQYAGIAYSTLVGIVDSRVPPTVLGPCWDTLSMSIVIGLALWDSSPVPTCACYTTAQYLVSCQLWSKLKDLYSLPKASHASHQPDEHDTYGLGDGLLSLWVALGISRWLEEYGQGYLGIGFIGLIHYFLPPCSVIEVWLFFLFPV